MQVQNSKITAPPRPLPSLKLKEEIRGERRPRMETFSERDPRRPRPGLRASSASPTFRALLADVKFNRAAASGRAPRRAQCVDHSRPRAKPTTTCWRTV